jgi:CubicO group peptidase (beta-lactamase class C family)
MMETVKPEIVGLSSKRLERIDRVMQEYVERQTFAGMVALVARRGKAAYLKAFGWQDIENRRPMTTDTIFQIYSMTKPITSVAVMMLCEQGKLRLADPVSRYLPDFKELKVIVPHDDGTYDLVPARREVTIHDLMTHSGGLGYGGDKDAQDKLYNSFYQHWDTEVERVLETRMRDFASHKLPLAFHPGTGFKYSFSIDVLGYIVQLASGQLFGDFLQEYIFAPLGMIDTGFHVPAEKAHRLALIYGPREGGGLKPARSYLREDLTQPTLDPSGGGGLLSTIGDYARFGQMMLNYGELDGVRILGRMTVDWMMQNHLPDGIHPMDEKCNGFGLGGAVLLRPGLSNRPGSPGKFGWGGAANTEWWIDPAEELNCVLMLQYMPCFTIPIVEDFAALVWQAID